MLMVSDTTTMLAIGLLSFINHTDQLVLNFPKQTLRQQDPSSQVGSQNNSRTWA
jgi:hypothetical protein